MARAAQVANTVPGCTEWCSTCRTVAVTGHHGPFSASELQKLVVEQPRPERDPDVVAAEAARDEARVVFDAADSVWQAALREQSNAHLRRDVDHATMRRLTEHTGQAYERRDAVWARVVAANEAIRAAQNRARQRESADVA